MALFGLRQTRCFLRLWYRKCGTDSPVLVTIGTDALAGGLDTTGASATFLLYHLASNPATQERLHAELRDTVLRSKLFTILPTLRCFAVGGRGACDRGQAGESALPKGLPDGESETGTGSSGNLTSSEN